MRESFGQDVAYDETRATMPVAEILTWDDYSSWGQWEPGELLGLSQAALRAELTGYRGSDWAQRALTWLREGIPAVVLASTRAADAIADGRGRVSLALGYGIQRLPVIVLRERRTQRARRGNAVERPAILGTATLDEQTGICGHCGRPIRHLVYLSTGPTVGRSCALKALGYTRRAVEAAPYVASSLSRLGGFHGYVMQDGRIMRAQRPYAPGGGYGPWTLTPA